MSKQVVKTAGLKVSKASATKVLSARVTPDVYDAWNTLAKNTDRNVSECLRDAIVFVNGKPKLADDDGISVPDELKRTLGAIGGGTVAGIVSYKALSSVLAYKFPNMDKNEIEVVSTLGAITIGLIIGTGIHKALSK